MSKHEVIAQKLKGKSNRAVARITAHDRKTVATYWNEYQQQMKVVCVGDDPRLVQEIIIEEPKYDVSNRSKVKYTAELDKALDVILEGEETKREKLGESNKQMLNCRQIHKELLGKGFDIGITTITGKIAEKRKRAREAFIRQHYEFGQRLEYDFGEVKLEIGGIVEKYYMAVFGAPASGFRWAYLYRNQKKDVFLDSHVRFFEMIGGTWSEMVYDNMRNVVTRFIGRNEKELSNDLVKMGIYYGFSINVTNCFAGNEKGFVESSVKTLRSEVFAKRYSFVTCAEAKAYLESCLVTINKSSSIEEEKVYLGDWRPPLEIARITENRVDKYSFIRVDNNFYSVPDYLVGRKVIVKTYPTEVVIYAGINKLCAHKRCEGAGKVSANIFHYLDTLLRKPGALSHSAALKQSKELKAVFDNHFSTQPRNFIECLRQNEGRPLPEIVAACIAVAQDRSTFTSKPEYGIAANVLMHSRQQLGAMSTAFLKRSERHAS